MMRKARYGLLPALMICFLYLNGAFAQETVTGTAPEAEQTIPFKRPSASDTGSVYRVVFATLFAIGLAAGSAWVLKRYLQHKGVMQSAKGGRITVTEMRRVSTKLTVYLVSIDGQHYLIAQAGDNITMIQHTAAVDE